MNPAQCTGLSPIHHKKKQKSRQKWRLFASFHRSHSAFVEKAL